MSTGNYKNVLLIGATGNVGKNVLSSLLADSTFNVTVLSRTNSNATFPSNVKVIKVDYSDVAALTKALVNQDVVISTVGGEGVATNFDEVLVQAAINANVKWIIPSEFGTDIEDPSVNIPFLAGKVAVVNLLKKNQSRIAYTLITTGAFLDWGLDNGFLGFDIKNHTAVLYDEGKNLISGTTLPTIGKAVVAVLHNPQLTLNKRIFVADATFTQQQALALLEKYTNTKWSVNNVTTANTRKEAEENFAKGNIPQALLGYLLSYLYAGSPEIDFEGRTINQDLGVPAISLDQIIKEAVERKNTAQ
jgi:NAD(P)-dependent dehydrogenase (short-subunit alcohol dehydrogenase family)